MEKELEKRLSWWIAKIGKSEAERQLILAGMSGSTAQKLIAGSYASQPKRLLLKAIEEALKKGA